MALTLLGLPPIPGSFMIPEFSSPPPPPEIPGDANGDRTVNELDVAVLVNGLGRNSDAARSAGDFDENGTIDLFDLMILQNHFGESGPLPAFAAAVSSAVPEPSPLTMLAIAAGTLPFTRRRMRRQ